MPIQNRCSFFPKYFQSAVALVLIGLSVIANLGFYVVMKTPFKNEDVIIALSEI